MAELWSNLLVAADIDGNLDGRLKWMSSWLWFITTPSRMWFLLMIKGGMCLSVSLRGLQPANIHSPILRWLTLTSTKPWPWLYLFLFVWPHCWTDVTILLYHPSDMESNFGCMSSTDQTGLMSSTVGSSARSWKIPTHNPSPITGRQLRWTLQL